ncbi:soluble scavenger receptor cysteine-rich domain-containing protein SSC5D-like [Portunus trituberculatus]|uniref:soluble scavenger receptor cysteine-rich domain-containing protein SSC5D-like n=1 Tax=Portunus trituberculatus TaxID=210409 RepID=UPI001E1D0791|nr:soluble scavenger receptor cysteine-rich domain-containing protein SSC5D-like [Portunus trituberculatus]
MATPQNPAVKKEASVSRVALSEGDAAFKPHSAKTLHPATTPLPYSTSHPPNFLTASLTPPNPPLLHLSLPHTSSQPPSLHHNPALLHLSLPHFLSLPHSTTPSLTPPLTHQLPHSLSSLHHTLPYSTSLSHTSFTPSLTPPVCFSHPLPRFPHPPILSHLLSYPLHSFTLTQRRAIRR